MARMAFNTCGFFKAAQELHDRLKAELWRLERLDEEPERTFEEAAIRFLQASEGQRDYQTKIRHVRYWHVQHGTPLFALKELGGWKTLEMVKKYAHLGNEHLVKYANAVTFLARFDSETKTPPNMVALKN